MRLSVPVCIQKYLRTSLATLVLLHAPSHTLLWHQRVSIFFQWQCKAGKELLP